MCRMGRSSSGDEVLIELDPTLNRADQDRASNEYQAAKVDAARLRALIAGQSTFEAPADGDPQHVLLQRQLLRDQLAEYQARVGTAQHLIDQRKAALDQTNENIRRLEATVPMEAERAEAFKKLLEHDAVDEDGFPSSRAATDRQNPRTWPGSARSCIKISPRSLKRRATTARFVSEFQQIETGGTFDYWKPRPRHWFRMSRKRDRRRTFSD